MKVFIALSAATLALPLAAEAAPGFAARAPAMSMAPTFAPTWHGTMVNPNAGGGGSGLGERSRLPDQARAASHDKAADQAAGLAKAKSDRSDMRRDTGQAPPK